MYNLKARLEALGKTQVWLLIELRKKGVVTQPPQLCNILNGLYTYPKAKSVMEMCNTIIKEAEENANCRTTSG